MTTKGYSHHSCKVTLAMNKDIFLAYVMNANHRMKKKMNRFPNLIETLFFLSIDLVAPQTVTRTQKLKMLCEMYHKRRPLLN